MAHAPSKYFLAAVAMLAANICHGFGADGHMAVGAVADQLLQGTAAAAKVKEILGGQSLEDAAVWADCARGVFQNKTDKTFDYKNDDARFRECTKFNDEPEKSRLIAYVKANWEQCGTAKGNETCHKQYHYTDVALQRSTYVERETGTNTHDVVHAINAAIAVLKGRTPSEPFKIGQPADANDPKRAQIEALRLLAHFIGDIHQPLHVKAVYLNLEGQLVDPDVDGFDPKSETIGGNMLYDGVRSLHSEWDDIPERFMVGKASSQDILGAARLVPNTPGDVMSWSTAWANESLELGRFAFGPLKYQKQTKVGPEQRIGWPVTGIDDTYRQNADAVKMQAIARAGARLAQVLQTLWPEPLVACNGATGAANGYLQAADLPDVRLWLPLQPPANSAQEVADQAVFFQTRALLSQAAGLSAAEDDVFEPADVLPRFRAALGPYYKDPAKTACLVRLFTNLEADAGRLVAPIKKSVSDGGRVRPFVKFAEAPSCLAPVDMAGHAQEDLVTWHLDKTGAYPSTHALVGMAFGLILTEAVPERGAQLMQRGLEFGQSRVVCGFHWQSDVDAGRLAAAALLARLRGNGAFARDLSAAIQEVRASK